MPRPFLGLFPLVLAILTCLLAGCSTGARAHAKAAAFSQLSSADQQLVRAGKIREGLSKDAVYIAWGKPDIKRPDVFGGNKAETWLYIGFTSPSMTQKLQLRPRQTQVVVWTETYRQQGAYRTAVFQGDTLVAWDENLPL